MHISQYLKRGKKGTIQNGYIPHFEGYSRYFTDIAHAYLDYVIAVASACVVFTDSDQNFWYKWYQIENLGFKLVIDSVLEILLCQCWWCSTNVLVTYVVKDSGYTNILQDKTLFCAFEVGNIVCWLVNPPIAKLDLFKSLDCRWICKTYAEYCYRNLATVRRLVQSPTLQSTIFCGVHSDLRGKGIRVSPTWRCQSQF